MLSFQIHPEAKTPLYEQIYNEIKERILDGTLLYNEKLPSTRVMSSTLGVSRNTIDTAYYQLQAEGFIDSAAKSGFFVCQIDASDHAWQQKPALHQKKETKVFPAQQQPEIDFSPFSIDITHFPQSVWKKLSRQCLDDAKGIFLLGEHFGDQALRSAIYDYVRSSREVKCHPEQIVIGAGVDYLLQMLSLTFTHLRLKNVTMENPCYMKAARIFSNNNLQVTFGNLDEKGLTTDSIQATTNLVYITPSHQYPLGTVMPYGRRKELLHWALESSKRYLIEDDHDSEFRYKGKPIPALQGMDTGDRVIYIGTFSKSIAPAIRVGYMILPPKILKAYETVCGHYSCTVSRLEQAILTRFLAEGYFEKHVNRMRKIYKNKHDLVLDCLSPAVKNKIIRIAGDNGGLHIVIQLSPDLEEDVCIDRAQKAGIKLYGLKNHYFPDTKNRKPAILLGYSNLSDEQIKKGIQILLDTHVFS